MKIKPFQPLLRNIPFCSLGEVGGAGAEPPQSLTVAAEVVQTVLPLEWSGRKRKAGFFYPVPRFRRRNGNGKNPDGQGFKSGDYLRSLRKKYYSSLDGLDRRNGMKRPLFLAGGYGIMFFNTERQIQIYGDRKMDKKSFQRVTIVIFGIVVLLILGVIVKLFIIGEPVDGKQVNYTTSINEANLELHVVSSESAVALRGWKYEQDGDTLFISMRKVLTSPFFSEGYYETSIDIQSIDYIYLGGQIIWQREN